VSKFCAFPVDNVSWTQRSERNAISGKHSLSNVARTVECLHRETGKYMVGGGAENVSPTQSFFSFVHS